MKTEFLDMLLTRRSVRAYKPDPVPEALLEEVLRAGTCARRDLPPERGRDG